jgi:hypothetical protein
MCLYKDQIWNVLYQFKSKFGMYLRQVFTKMTVYKKIYIIKMFVQLKTLPTRTIQYKIIDTSWFWKSRGYGTLKIIKTNHNYSLELIKRTILYVINHWTNDKIPRHFIYNIINRIPHLIWHMYIYKITFMKLRLII